MVTISDEARPCAALFRRNPSRLTQASLAPTSCVVGVTGQTRSEAGYSGGDDVVDPCCACDRRNSRAGPVSGKKISTPSTVRLRRVRDPQEKAPRQGRVARGEVARLGGRNGAEEDLKRRRTKHRDSGHTAKKRAARSRPSPTQLKRDARRGRFPAGFRSSNTPSTPSRRLRFRVIWHPTRAGWYQR